MSKHFTTDELEAIAADIAAELEEAEKTPGSTGYKSALYACQRKAEQFRDTPSAV